MVKGEPTFADLLFQARNEYMNLQDKLEDQVNDKVLSADLYEDITFDETDTSVEFKNVKQGTTLTPEQQQALWDMGFAQTWLCYPDGWETRYVKNGDPKGLTRKGVTKLNLA